MEAPAAKEIIPIQTSLVTSAVSVTCIPLLSDGLRCSLRGGCLIRCTLHETHLLLFLHNKMQLGFPPSPFLLLATSVVIVLASVVVLPVVLMVYISSSNLFPLDFFSSFISHMGAMDTVTAQAGYSGAMSHNKEQFLRHVYLFCVGVFFFLQGAGAEH